MKRTGMTTEPGALSLIEQAMHLLRRGNWPALAEYYLGSLPFVLALLYFWSDMSRNAMAGWYCGPSAGGLALLFIWMKYWQVRFCRRLLCGLRGRPAERWSISRSLGAVARHAALHASGTVILPLAAIVMLPFGWVYAFYQNVCVLDGPDQKSTRALIREATAQSALWPLQNHYFLAIVSTFGLIVLLALGGGLVAVPYLLRGVLGIETAFTLSGLRLLNTTFLAALCALTYLCIDPIIKAAYVLRCFYGVSLKTGDDLKSALKPFITASVMLTAIILVVMPDASALARDQKSPESWKAASSDPEYARRLDSAIENVLQQRRFAWRLPRKKLIEPTQQPGWMESISRWILDGISDLVRPVARWIKAFYKWLSEKLPHFKFSRPGKGMDSRGLIRLIFYALGFGLLLLLIYWLGKWLLRRRPPPADHTARAEPAAVDLTNESLSAQDLPLHQWMAMAQDLIASQDFRSALRALYLSVLAVLADHQRVKVARYKSNLDYVRELSRRVHAEPELLAAFQWCVRIFERSWYGMYPVSRSQVEDYINQQKRIVELVQVTA